MNEASVQIMLVQISKTNGLEIRKLWQKLVSLGNPKLTLNKVIEVSSALHKYGAVEIRN